jgi:hypothetical protein
MAWAHTPEVKKSPVCMQSIEQNVVTQILKMDRSYYSMGYAYISHVNTYVDPI